MPRKKLQRRRKASIKSSENMIFDNDTLIEILLRVPAKSLIRFKCVCKHWLTLISDPKFSHDHANRNQNPLPSGIYFYSNPYSSQKSLKSLSFQKNSTLPPVNYKRAKIVHICNGLILSSYIAGKLYSVCNPTTQKHKLLPKINNDREYSIWNFFACLVFDPAKSPHYKVVLIVYKFHSESKIHIFSSKESLWKSVILFDLPSTMMTRIVILNGGIHWLSTDNFHCKIMVHEEKFERTQMPRDPKVLTTEIRFFGECGENLFLVLGKIRSYACRVFEMERDNNACNWIVRYRVNLWQKIPPQVGERTKFHVLGVVKGSNKSGLELVLATGGGFLLYDLENRAFEELCFDFVSAEFDEMYDRVSDFVHQFTECLVPI